eukprot:TRINITY_DN8234_c0_g1_i1.p1 TRINITY_DN8234_c0_g1~~TRINITY_DN8234_c0_g1_i1.p1  ORF type:complete len:739 (-),score=145.88 TRINITY_DN8234_c0_g1_i1:134-2350(-)
MLFLPPGHRLTGTQEDHKANQVQVCLRLASAAISYRFHFICLTLKQRRLEERCLFKNSMGSEFSKHVPGSKPEDASKDSLLHACKKHLKFRRNHDERKHGGGKAFSAVEFSGIVRIVILRANLPFKDKWFACVSIGEQTFKTATSNNTNEPVWNSEVKVALEANGPRIARISVFETNRLSKSNLVGYCEIDLSGMFTDELHSPSKTVDLLDPNSTTTSMGSISLSYKFEDPMDTERQFARRLLSIVDYDEDGQLSLNEFHGLVNAFGNNVAYNKLDELFQTADHDGNGVVSADELSNLLAFYNDKEPLINKCPVCGEELGMTDNLNDMIHISLCFDEGTGNQVMSGGFLTEKQASYGWLFKLSEWAHLSSYDIGLKSGSSAAHILVFDRRTKRLVEEVIDSKIILSLRAIYQSRVGLSLIDKGTKAFLESISKKQGEHMNSHDSAKEIPKFIKFFEDRINVDEFKHPPEYFKTFNEFFIRELKPHARPIACKDNDHVAICGADSRLMAFQSQIKGKRFWIKGRKFSIEGLLGNQSYSKVFDDGALVIFRLAPQDYHRFHLPISGVVGKFKEIPGQLYTVNPIAVNSKYCNVFTENKRVVCIIRSEEFGKMAFVAIGATMVGSITFTRNEGEYVKKGEQFGYFSFGGSTVICVFERGAIELDEDLLANSERSLETLVSVGMTLGISKHVKLLNQDFGKYARPTRHDSIAGLDNEIAKKGVIVTDSANVIQGHLGFGEEE